MNRLYPIQQLEFEAKTVAVLGLEQTAGDGGVPGRTLDALARLDGVIGVSPKMRSHFPARLFGGEEIFRATLRAEAYLDGLAEEEGQRELLAGEPTAFSDRGEVNHCSSSAECGESGQCIDGICFYDSCSGDSDCADGRRCRRSSCSADSECDLEGEVSCEEGRCATGVCIQTCTPGEGECGLRETCVSGLCDSDEECLGGTCVGRSAPLGSVSLCHAIWTLRNISSAWTKVEGAN